MNSTSHPNTERLAAYLDRPEDSEFRDLSLHLVSCENCRAQVSALNAVQDELAKIYMTTDQQYTEDDTGLARAMHKQHIEQYIDDQLYGEEKQKVEMMIEENSRALKAALHYACHSSAMQRELPKFTDQQIPVQPELQAKQNQSVSPNFILSIKDWLSLRTPIWLSVPVTAVTTALLVFVLTLNFTPYSRDITIASYQDNAVIHFQPKNQPPGIGFFNKALKTTQPYASMQIKLVEKSTIALSWLAVEKAESYTVRLQMFKGGQKIKLGEITTKDTGTEFDGINTDGDHRYEWILSGKTTDAKTFYTSGGFVINTRDD